MRRGILNSAGNCRAWTAAFCGLVFLLVAPATRAAETNLLAEFAVRRWAVEDGLPEAVITSISQLSDGYLWCTTPHHLVRFDGVHFSEGEFAGITKERQGVLLGAYRDAQGALWCYGTGGAWRHDKSGWLTVPVARQPAAAPEILQLQEGSDHTLWAATSVGICRFDGQSLVRLPIAGAPGETPVSLVGVDTGPKGGFWLVADHALLHFQQGAYQPVELPADVPAREVTRVASGNSGLLWVIAADQLYCRRGLVWTTLPLPLPGDNGPLQITTMQEGEEGALWVGCVYGIYRWQHEEWSEFTARAGIYFPMDVRSLAQDHEGNVWVGTSGGLVRLRRTPLRVYRTGMPWGGESITAMLAESPTNFWTAVAGGGLLVGEPKAFHLVRLGALPENATVSALLRGRDGTLWVGTQGESLWRYHDNGTAERVEQATGSSLSAKGISALLEDRRGRLWVGTWDGLMTLNEAGQLASVAINDGHGGFTQPPVDTVHVLYEDHAGRIWAGYQSLGLICFFPDGRTQRYQMSDGLPGDSIRALYEDSANNLWIGTTRGLVMWNGQQHFVFTTANGLIDNVVLQIMEDQKGELWLGTRYGLMRIKRSEFVKVAANHKTTLTTRVFDTESGMGDDESIGGLGVLAAKTADGRIWFPTMEGIVMVDPQQIPTQPINPRVYVEEIDANDKPCYTLSLANTPAVVQQLHLRLPQGARDMEVHFTAPMFSAPERARFRYRLQGVDHDFSHAVLDRTVHYQRLAAGVYHFQVKARDRDGAWSDLSPAITISVPPYFWETIWFWTLIGVGGIGLVGLAVRTYDQRKTVRQLQALEARHAVERERARIARDIHDDVGAGLAEVAMLSELAQDEAAQPSALHEHLDDIFQRARQMTQSLDEIVWAINPANDTIESFISYVSEYVQDFLTAAGVACRLDLPRETPPVAISASVRHHLCLAIKESLHNIVKHAAASEVLLRVAVTYPELTVTIEDNGRGFVYTNAPGVASGRDGLTNLRTRLREIDGDLQHESRLGAGTRLVMSVRLSTKPSTLKETTEPA